MLKVSNKLVSVIIVTKKISSYLEPCLDSLKNQTYNPAEIIVIDNSFDSDFSRKILETFPYVRLYQQQENISYCAALNLGITLSRGNFLLCLNDDVVLDRRFIEKALAGFDIDEKIGMVGGKILRSGKKIIDSTGLFLSIWRTAKERGYGKLDRGQFEKEGYIFGVGGAVAFYRKDMLGAIKEDNNYFDSDFHFFYEDLDIAWRAQHLGWRGYYIPQAIAYHVRGGTARNSQGIDRRFARFYLSDELQSDLIKNRYLAIIKNDTALGLLLHLPMIILYDLMMWGYIVLFKPRLVKISLCNIKYLILALNKRFRSNIG